MKKFLALILLIAVVAMTLVSCTVGAAGPAGADGRDGRDGKDGKDGAVGEQGPQGEKGDTGATGAQGPQGEKGDAGTTGEAGKSAYQLYKEKFGYEWTEEEWLYDLVNGNLSMRTPCTVTFDSNSGSDVIPQIVAYGKKASEPTPPTKEGYTFAGWYLEEEKWSFIGYTVTSDITLTARWEVQKYGLPVSSGILLREYSPNASIFFPSTGDYRAHDGIDIQTEENASVYAITDGTISKIWVDPFWGHCISIEHAGGIVSIYKNLGDTLPSGIEEGIFVREGMLIGVVGSSSTLEVADNPHLHFEIIHNGATVDPLDYLADDVLDNLI